MRLDAVEDARESREQRGGEQLLRLGRPAPSEQQCREGSTNELSRNDLRADVVCVSGWASRRGEMRREIK